MRWYSSSGEYAFLSVGAVARGVIAVGGVAHGIVAIGGFISVGVVSIGMNAVGSVLAVGMNAVGPVALSLINALGFFVLAGVNGWGAWSHSGTNAMGLAPSGGVNNDVSVIPSVLVIVLGLVLSSIFRGKRERRAGHEPMSLRAFLRQPGATDSSVIADLGRIGDDGFDLVDGGRSQSCRAEPGIVEDARRVVDESLTRPAHVVVRLIRAEVEVPDATAPPPGYRERIREIRRELVLCHGVEAAPPRETWLPKDADEMQWVVAWSTRAAVVAMVVAVFRLSW